MSVSFFVFFVLANLWVILLSSRALFLMFYCKRQRVESGYLDQFQIWTGQTVSVKSFRYVPTFFVPAIYEEIEFLLDDKEYKIKMWEMLYSKEKEHPLHVRSAFWDIINRRKNKIDNPVFIEK